MNNKEIEVSFIYGNEDFEKIIKEIVIRKLNTYKNQSRTPIIINSGSEIK